MTGTRAVAFLRLYFVCFLYPSYVRPVPSLL